MDFFNYLLQHASSLWVGWRMSDKLMKNLFLRVQEPSRTLPLDHLFVPCFILNKSFQKERYRKIRRSVEIPACYRKIRKPIHTRRIKSVHLTGVQWNPSHHVRYRKLVQQEQLSDVLYLRQWTLWLSLNATLPSIFAWKLFFPSRISEWPLVQARDTPSCN